MKSDSLSKRTLIYLIGKFFVQGIGLLSNIIFVRLLSTNDFGVVSVFTAWVSIATIIVGFRIDGTINNARLEFDSDFEKYCSSAMFLSTIWFVACSFFAIMVCSLLKIALNIEIWMVFLILLSSYGTSIVNFRTVYYASKKDPISNLKLSVLNSVLILGVSILLVICLDENKYIGRIIGITIPSFLMGVWVAIGIIRRGKCFYNKTYWKYAISLSFPLIFSGLSSVILSQCDRVMLGEMLSASDAGIYSFGYTIAMPVFVVLNAFSESWTPDYYDCLKGKIYNELHLHMNRYMWTFVLITVFYMCVSPEVLMVFGTNDYYSGKIVVFLVISMYFVYFLQSWAVNYEFYHKKTKAIALGFVLSAMVNIVLNYFLIKIYGMNGAASASVLSSLALFLFHEIIVRHVTSEYHVPFIFLLKGIVLVSAALLLCIIFADILWIRFLISVICIIALGVRLVKYKGFI